MQRRTWIGLVGAGGAALAIPAWLRRDHSTVRPESTPVATTVPHTATSAGRRFIDASGNVVDLHAVDALVEFRAPDGSLRRSATVQNPMGIAATSAGVLQILTLEGAVHSFTADGTAKSVVELAGLASPRDLVIDADQLVVANTLGHRIAVFDANGKSKSTLGAASGSAQLDGPSSVALQPDGGYYVADLGNARIAAFSASGALEDSFGEYGRADGQMLAPRCVRVDGQGRVHVADLVAGCVHVFDREHRFVERKQYKLPDGTPALVQWLATAPDGSIVPSFA